MKGLCLILIGTFLTAGKVSCKRTPQGGPFVELTSEGIVKETEEVAQARAVHVAAREAIVNKLEKARQADSQRGSKDKVLFLDKMSKEVPINPPPAFRSVKMLRPVKRAGHLKTIRDVESEPPGVVNYEPTFYDAQRQLAYVAPPVPLVQHLADSPPEVGQLQRKVLLRTIRKPCGCS